MFLVLNFLNFLSVPWGFFPNFFFLNKPWVTTPINLTAGPWPGININHLWGRSLRGSLACFEVERFYCPLGTSRCVIRFDTAVFLWMTVMLTNWDTLGSQGIQDDFFYCFPPCSKAACELWTSFFLGWTCVKFLVIFFGIFCLHQLTIIKYTNSNFFFCVEYSNGDNLRVSGRLNLYVSILLLPVRFQGGSELWWLHEPFFRLGFGPVAIFFYFSPPDYDQGNNI